ncbi:MAG TPA: universal stress protein [Candidatus Angelobacter sp.]|nr:universal stress protein [Candidatus Angelobacter sp.]
MRVMIAVDGSDSSQIVLEEALARPWPAGTHFCLLTVIDPFFFTRAPLLLSEAREAGAKFLGQAAERLGAAGWSTEVEVPLGNPRHAINESAEAWRADLLLVGSHGLHALARLAFGSTVGAVVRHAKCSVEIVRAPRTKVIPGKRGKRILLATDGSEFSAAAAKSIAERPWPKDSDLKIISVPEFSLWLGEFPSYQLAQVEELNESALDAARAAVALAKESLRRADLPVSTHVPVEREAPAKVILEEAEAWGADLIVVGSHGRRGFDRLAMGSISEALAMHARCSVEVVRAPQKVELGQKKGEAYESERSHDEHAVHVP